MLEELEYAKQQAVALGHAGEPALTDYLGGRAQMLTILARTLKRLREQAWVSLRANPRGPVQQIGLEMSRMLEEAERAFAAVESGVSMAELRGDRVEGAEAFRVAHGELQGSAARWREAWPLFDPEEIEAAAGRMRGGHGLTLEEARRELDAAP